MDDIAPAQPQGGADGAELGAPPVAVPGARAEGSVLCGNEPQESVGEALLVQN